MLDQHDSLDSFWTSIAVPTQLVTGIGRYFSPEGLGRRAFPEIRASKIRSSPLREMVRQVARRLRVDVLTRHESGWASVDAVYQSLDRDVSGHLRRRRPAADSLGIYVFEDGALQSLQEAKRLGLRRVYELASPYWRSANAILKEEADLQPNFARTLLGLSDSVEKYARKEDEIRLSDEIVVASRFAKKCLIEHYPGTCSVSVVPYGCPRPVVLRPSSRPPGGPLEVIFVGNVTQAKGFGYLLAALAMLSVPYRLTVAGAWPLGLPAEWATFLSSRNCRVLGHVPHPALLRYMVQSHVMVLPSLLDAFGLVVGEAMSAGLPVITTPNVGASDLVIDGQNGFIVPVRDVDLLATKLTQLYQDEDLRARLGNNALETASANQWNKYQAALTCLLKRRAPND